MKQLIFLLALAAGTVIAQGPPGRRGHEPVEDQCTAGSCDTDEECHTTPRGTRCVSIDRVPCVADSDCTDSSRSGVCFKPTAGADLGMCEGCASDTDCASSSNGATCGKRSTSDLYGRCIECQADADCASTEFCDAPQRRGRGPGRGRGGGRRGGGGRGGNRGRNRRGRNKRQAGGPTFQCVAKQAAGSACRRNEECTNGSCVGRVCN